MSIEYLLQKRFLFAIANSSKVSINAYKSDQDYHIFIQIKNFVKFYSNY